MKKSGGAGRKAGGKASRQDGDPRTPKLTDDNNWEVRLGFLMHDVSRLRRGVVDEFMKPAGLTRSQWWILAHLARHDGMIQSDLAGVLEIGKAALGGLVDRLETSGFIERRADSNDRRVKRICLTSRGTAVIDEMRIYTHEMSEQMLEGLDTAARHALAEGLAVVKKNLLTLKGESNAR